MDLKNLILNQVDRKTQEVIIPEWLDADGQPIKLKLQAMSAAQKDKWEVDLQAKGGGFNLQNIRARLAAVSIVDDKGAPVFSDKDVEALGCKSGAAMSRIYEVAEKLNYMSKEDIDNLAKNS